ncbi:TPA: hypothetical protein QDB08_003933 [Burkholderia vietnamiensis]|uniref:hypothetical protein n=1 Tax=Burkholderia vietnamiensis TaxID=60552 RepID=UPI00159499A6|nr:hypothetical protein [Burkholderia vietnamiensis]HDR9010940.1 hypothetical protein [Burkholderia vietnamiensis]HDR9017152.1 hypothetical protein [Burkholderia vietnamiensis]
MNSTNIKISSIVIFATLILAACGGGNGDSGSSNSSSSQPYTVAYIDYNANSGISGSAWNGASFVDNVPTKTNSQTITQNGWTGQITYGTSSKSAVLQVNNSAVANTSPISVVGSATTKIFDPYGATGTPLGTSVEPNLDGAYEICGAAPAGSISDNGFAASDILITSSATQVINVSELIGRSFTFNQYCDPANQSNPQTLTFDSSGNANFKLYTGSTNSGSLTAVQVPSASFQSALNGTPYGDSQQGQTIWTAYRFVTQNGVVKYAIIERGSADGNYIGIWY